MKMIQGQGSASVRVQGIRTQSKPTGLGRDLQGSVGERDQRLEGSVMGRDLVLEGISHRARPCSVHSLNSQISLSLPREKYFSASISPLFQIYS